MSEFNIEVQGGSSVRLPTAGKYCDRDIIVTASGGGGTEEIEQIIDQSGVLDSTDGTATEKVEKLIDKAEDENAWYELSGYFTNNFPSFSKMTCETLPRMDLSNVTDLRYTFSEMSNLKRINFYMNTENCTIFNSCFQRTAKLEYIKGINTSKATVVGGMFNDCAVLKTIEEPFDFSSHTENISAFSWANAIEYIRFVPETIKAPIVFRTPVLSDESIQSIIDGLATVETTQKLTLHTTVVSRLSEAQIEQIYSKNWEVG